MIVREIFLPVLMKTDVTFRLFGTINSVKSSVPGGGAMTVLQGLLGFEPLSWMGPSFQRTPIEHLARVKKSKSLQDFQGVTVIWASERGRHGHPVFLSVDPAISSHRLQTLSQTYDELHVTLGLLNINDCLRLVDE